jgi:drug/metabolite transporter (DMT)-like permease
MKSKIQFSLSMVIFATIGLFVRYIDLPSPEIAMLRGFIGCIFLFVVIFFMKKKISWPNIRKNGVLLLLSGVALGCNWVFLFQAYKHTTIANASLSYYFAPVFVLILSPLLLKETLSVKKLACISVSVLGMFLVMNGSANAGGAVDHLTGILYGLTAAAFYASLMLLNKFIRGLTGLETTLIQLGVAALALLAYVLLTQEFGLLHIDGVSVVLLILLGIIHTGAGFLLFFTGMQGLKGQSIAALSYLDPLTSVFLSAIVLGESMGALQMVGGALLLGATFVSEGFPGKRTKEMEKT